MSRLGQGKVIVRRVYSVPEHITMFGAGAIMIGAVYPTIMAHDGGHGVPCPFRALTGIPCPFCGLTTATVALAHGQFRTAAGTSPLVCLAAILVAATVPVLAARAAGLMSAPRPASDRTRRRVTVVTCVIVGLNWLFELHRYGFL
jgi:glycerol-3-phosphate acyltransferase PlsY